MSQAQPFLHSPFASSVRPPYTLPPSLIAVGTASRATPRSSTLPRASSTRTTTAGAPRATWYARGDDEEKAQGRAAPGLSHPPSLSFVLAQIEFMKDPSAAPPPPPPPEPKWSESGTPVAHLSDSDFEVRRARGAVGAAAVGGAAVGIPSDPLFFHHTRRVR